MNEVEIILTERVKRDYRKLSSDIQQKFKKQLRFFAANPRHPSLQIQRIRGTEYWEFYIDIAYRGVFRREGSMVFILAAGPHKVIDEFRR